MKHTLEGASSVSNYLEQGNLRCHAAHMIAANGVICGSDTGYQMKCACPILRSSQSFKVCPVTTLLSYWDIVAIL